MSTADVARLQEWCEHLLRRLDARDAEINRLRAIAYDRPTPKGTIIGDNDVELPGDQYDISD